MKKDFKEWINGWKESTVDLFKDPDMMDSFLRIKEKQYWDNKAEKRRYKIKTIYDLYNSHR